MASINHVNAPLLWDKQIAENNNPHQRACIRPNTPLDPSCTKGREERGNYHLVLSHGSKVYTRVNSSIFSFQYSKPRTITRMQVPSHYFSGLWARLVHSPHESSHTPEARRSNGVAIANNTSHHASACEV
jgi:hypothetical protein